MTEAVTGNTGRFMCELGAGGSVGTADDVTLITLVLHLGGRRRYPRRPEHKPGDGGRAGYGVSEGYLLTASPVGYWSFALTEHSFKVNSSRVQFNQSNGAERRLRRFSSVKLHVLNYKL